MSALICSRCDGKGYEPSPTGVPMIGAPSCMACGGARRSLCPEAAERAAMTDGEFWDHVYGGGARGEPYDPDPSEITAQLDPCPVCGERGPCGYDSEGRPLIHTNSVEVDG